MDLRSRESTTSKKWAERKIINRMTKQIILIVLAIKGLLLILGLQSYLFFSGKTLTSSYWILGIWNRWDAQYYTSLAYQGYTSVGERSVYIAFFPFYPFLIATLNYITDDAVLSGVIISGIASVVLGVVFYKLVNLDFSSKTAMSAVWFLFIFPTSYFLHIPYTESLFLALAVGSFYCVRQEKWFLAGLLGCLACATRINGLILCLALPFEIYAIWRETKKFDKKWLWLGLMPLGFISYLLLNYAVMGNPLAFLDIQRAHWQKFLTYPWTAISGKINQVINQSEPTPKMEGIFELVFVAIGFFSIIIGWRKLRDSYKVWMIASWLLFVSTSFILSVPRYTLTMFPLFILIALAAKRRIPFALITVLSILNLAMFTIAFVQGRWAF